MTDSTNISKLSSTNTHIFDIIWNVGRDEPVKQQQQQYQQQQEPLIAQPKVKVQRKKYEIVQVKKCYNVSKLLIINLWKLNQIFIKIEFRITPNF